MSTNRWAVLREYWSKKIAAYLWRQSRILRAENSASSKGLVAAQREDIKNFNQFTIDLFEWKRMRAARELGKWGTTTPPVEATINLGRTVRGIEFVVRAVKWIKQDIEGTGLLPEIQRGLLVDFLGPDSILPQPEKTADGTIPDGFDMKAFLIFLDFKISWMEHIKNCMDETDHIDFEAEVHRSSVPLDSTEKLDRREAHFERQLYRAMAELDRLQTQRRGENGPPQATSSSRPGALAARDYYETKPTSTFSSPCLTVPEM